MQRFEPDARASTGGEALEDLQLASDIAWKDQYLWVSNNRLFSLIEFALKVGEETARSDPERGYVEKLHRFYGQELFPGIGFDLDLRFPTVEEKKFWAGVFHDVCRGIFLRQLGKHEVTYWQSSAIGDAYVIARMLTRAVQEAEQAWHPDTENGREADAYHAGRINLRV
jgi:hypothetical protein